MAAQQQQQHAAAAQGHRRRPGFLATVTGLVVVVLLARNCGTAEEASLPVAFLGKKQRMVAQIVEDCFPGAAKGRDLMVQVLDTLRPYGVKRGNTVYGESICSDEINGDRGHLPGLLANYFGNHFTLGGIGGVPYVGKTGFAAFSHHVPDDGHVVIVFGPHIGFTLDGEAGKFLRTGQHDSSTACGAVIAAHNQNLGGRMPADPQDAQQSWLRSKLTSVQSVQAAKNPMVELVMLAYKEVEKEMLAIVNTGFGSGNLVLIGGIQINMPYPMEGYFMPLHFSIRSASKKKPVDLLKALK